MHSNEPSGIRLSRELKVKRFIALASYTTWHIGGKAEWFSQPNNISEIKSLIAWSNERKIPCTIIGAGSNLLINDEGIKGLVICLKKLHGYEINEKNGVIEAFSGENIPSLARRAAKGGLHGLEWAAGIPGTLGGAVVMNAGAQGGSFSDCIDSVKVLTINGGEQLELPVKDLNYAYRSSRLQKNQFIVLSAKLKLEPGYDPQTILKTTNSNLQLRINTQPYDKPSCGSVFRNPMPYKAGKLIEELGLKGLCIGGAEVSKLHANFIVNKGDATAHDIDQLITVIQNKIQSAYGLQLHPEVKRLGFDISI